MRKVRSDIDFAVEYEGERWVLDLFEYRNERGEGQLRVSRIRGNVTTPLLKEALQLEADSRALRLY
jgi:hypothetical protein